MFHSLSHLSVSPGTGLVKSLSWDLKILLLQFFLLPSCILNAELACQRAGRNAATLLSGWVFVRVTALGFFPSNYLKQIGSRIKVAGL